MNHRQLLVFSSIAALASQPASAFALNRNSREYANMVRWGLFVHCAQERIKSKEDRQFLYYYIQLGLGIKKSHLSVTADKDYLEDVDKFVADQKSKDAEFCKNTIDNMYSKLGKPVPEAPEPSEKPKAEAGLEGKSDLDSKKHKEDKQVHDDCLNAKDYEGCVRVRSGASKNESPVADDCDENSCVIKTKGKDVFGLPKPPVGWFYLTWQDGVGRSYFSQVSRVRHNGADDRYVAIRRIDRWYQNPQQGRAGSFSSSGSTSTSCFDWGDSVSCSGSSPSLSYMPGTSSSPGGVRSKTITYVVDCKENTFAKYDGVKKARWSKIRENSDDAVAESVLKRCTDKNLSVISMRL